MSASQAFWEAPPRGFVEAPSRGFVKQGNMIIYFKGKRIFLGVNSREQGLSQ